MTSHLSKQQRPACRLMVVKIVDSGPMISHDDEEEEMTSQMETTVRTSPVKKRPISPVSSTNAKKIKVQPAPPAETKKKSSLKPVVTSKKTPTPANGPKPTTNGNETKSLKITLTKDAKTSEASKARPSTKIVKTQSMQEIKSSPPKAKPTSTTTTTATKKIPKLSIKLEPQSSNGTRESTSLPFDKQKKIPKKTSLPPAPTTTTTTVKMEKPSRSSIDSSSLNRTAEPTKGSVSASQKVVTKKVSAPLKRESSLPNIAATKSNQRTEETSTSSKGTPSPSVPPRPKTSMKKTISDRVVSSSSSLRVEPPSQDLPSPAETVGSSLVPSTTNSPSVDQIHLSEESNSPLVEDQTVGTTTTTDDDDEDDNDDDLPTGLTNVDLRYKLIYIYNRFRSQALQDLNIFVRFFKRHHLIDSSALAMNSHPDNMFTYDLFSLSPSHIGELADDLGYVAPSTA